MATRIDLATRFLSDAHQLFVLHPGRSKKFYGDFIEQGRVFLDFPGVRLPEEVNSDDPHIRAMLRMGRQIAGWYGLGQPPEDIPSRDPNHYLTDNIDRLRARYFVEAEGLYATAKKGDLVICPGPDYMTYVYVGEFTEDFHPRYTARAEIYGDERIPARRVRWRSIDQRKAWFSDRLIALMQNPQALIQITNPDEKQEVYDLAYRNYVLSDAERGSGQVRITHEEIDLHELNESVEVISYLVAMYAAQDQNLLERFFDLPFEDAIAEFYDKTYLFDSRVLISSPGIISFRAKHLALPMFIAIMLALSGSGMADPDPDEVVIENTEEVDDRNECQIEASERVKQSMDMMGYKGWWNQFCAKRLEARELTGLESPITGIEVEED